MFLSTASARWRCSGVVFGLWLAAMGLGGAQTQTLTIDRIAAATDLTLIPPGNVYVQPTGDLYLDPTGNDVFPVSSYDINLGSLSKKFLTLHAAELWVETLVAQSTIATIGGRILVGPTTSLVQDVAAAATAIDVKHNNLTAGDVVYLEANGKVEFMTIGTGPFAYGDWYTYNVTRNLDGTGANDWYAGDAVFNSGQTGNGFIDLYSVRGVKASSEVGPTIVGNERQSSTYNDWESRWAIGNLNGVYGYSATTYGAAFGDPSDLNVTIDATNGFRVRDAGTTVRGQWKANGDVVIGRTANSRARLELDDTNGIKVISRDAGGSDSTVGQWKTDGSLVVGPVADTKTRIELSSAGTMSFIHRASSTDATKLSIDGTTGTLSLVGNLTVGTGGAIYSGATAYGTGTGFWMDYNAGTPRFRIGDPSGNRLFVEGTTIEMRTNWLDLDDEFGVRLDSTSLCFDWGASARLCYASGDITSNTDFIPSSDDAVTLGASDKRWGEIYATFTADDAGSDTHYPLIVDAGRIMSKSSGVNDPEGDTAVSSGGGLCPASQWIQALSVEYGIVTGITCSP